MFRRTVMLVAALVPIGALAGVTVATGQGAKDRKDLSATLTGKKEVGPDGKKGAGDPNGFGSFTAIAADGKICFGITVRAIDKPVAAHIHRGGPNKAGPVVVTLTAPDQGTAGASSGCVDVPSALSRAIFRNPTKYYANVHTTAFPGGAVRGQLSPR